MTKTSYLVAAIGARHAFLTACYARTAAEAQAATAALFIDEYGEEECETICFDVGAKPGFFVEGDPAYIRSVVVQEAAK